MLYDTMIVGGGPAGLTAALYAGRAGHTTVLFEKMFVGGQAVTTYEIENYPGVPAVSGPELVQKMEEQTKLFGVTTIHEEVVSLSLEGKVKTVTTTNGQYQGKTVILTTGARPKMLEVPGEQEFWGRGVSVCATCDGAFYKGKVAAVVGGGNTAMENAIFLSKFCKMVYLIHRRDTLRGEKSLMNRLEALPNVSFVWDTVVEKILGDKVVAGVGLRRVKNGGNFYPPRGRGICIHWGAAQQWVGPGRPGNRCLRIPCNRSKYVHPDSRRLRCGGCETYPIKTNCHSSSRRCSSCLQRIHLFGRRGKFPGIGKPQLEFPLSPIWWGESSLHSVALDWLKSKAIFYNHTWGMVVFSLSP